MKGAQSWSRPRLLVSSALALAAAAAALVVFVLGGGAAHANSQAASPAFNYAVLSGSSVGDASRLAPPTGNLIDEGNRPIGSTVTEVDTGTSNLTVTVARSTEGGVCIGVERHGGRGGGNTCGVPFLLPTGVTAEVHEDNGPTTIAGIVPNGVSAVKVGFGDGTSQTVNVASNVWTLENAPADMTSTTNITRG